MQALVKAIRFYDDAAADGHNADGVVNVPVKYSFIKDPAAVHQAIVSQVVAPDGDIGLQSALIADDMGLFQGHQEIDGKVTVNAVVSLGYIHEAAMALGPYVKKTTMQYLDVLPFVYALRPSLPASGPTWWWGLAFLIADNSMNSVFVTVGRLLSA
jgi:hypothetical protein